MKTTVGIIGATGYGGIQLLRLLADHPQVDVVYLGAEQNVGIPIQKLYPFLSMDRVTEAVNITQITQRCEVVFLSAPKGVAVKLVPDLLAGGCRVIDLSADYRFHNLKTYEQWYDLPRQDQATASKAVYGLPELYREQLTTTRLVGCPGCYATASLLAVAPLLKQGLILPDSVIIDAKSGISGAGRNASADNLFAEADSTVVAYNIGRHRHIPEIEQVCSHLLGGTEIQVQFTPHRIPMSRGIMATLYGQMRDPGLVTEDMLMIYEAFYRLAPFVKIMGNGIYPQTKWVTGTNNCMIGLEADGRTGRIVVVSVIDNLLKGQSSQAVQCMNLMLGWEETLGLPRLGYYP